jgi:hypothetical protein
MNQRGFEGILITIAIVVMFSQWSAYSRLTEQLEVETAALTVQTERIAIMEAKIARDDKLLDQYHLRPRQ